MSAARDAMVDSQIRPSDVTDPAIIAAFRTIPREVFLPPAAASLAYADMEAEAAPGRRLLGPRDLGKLIQSVEPQPGDKALEIAGATGYAAAILGKCVKTVVTLDPSPDLSFAARAALDKCALANVTAVCTDARSGWPDAAPYDIIVLNGATEFVPQAWLDQLAEGGRLGVILRQGRAGQARIYLKTGGRCAYRVAFDAFPFLAPDMIQEKVFAL
jgi:protein-L-isoaspartate(D-aspartate) O-methyltransferase